jgi:predicted Zn-dependent protease
VQNYYDLTDGLDEAVADGSQATVSEETTLGACVAAEIIARNGGLVKDVGISRQVTLVGRAIASASTRPHLRYVFGVLNSSVPNTYSAPGGFVFITRGAYEACDNYDQLAGLLAHEIAHVALRHPLRVIYEHAYMPVLSRVVRGITTEYDQFDKVVERVAMRTLSFGYPAYVEYRADLVGREFAYAAGFQRDGLEQFLRKMYDSVGDNPAVFTGHPRLIWRVRNLEQEFPPKFQKEEKRAVQRDRGPSKSPSLRRLK